MKKSELFFLEKQDLEKALQEIQYLEKNVFNRVLVVRLSHQIVPSKAVFGLEGKYWLLIHQVVLTQTKQMRK